MQINKDLLPKIETTPSFYAGEKELSFTAPYDCYAKITLYDHSWGYDGGDETVAISVTSGLPEVIYSKSGVITGGNLIARAVIAVAVYKCTSGNSYTFVRGASGSGGTKACTITAELFPINQ